MAKTSDFRDWAKQEVHDDVKVELDRVKRLPFSPAGFTVLIRRVSDYVYALAGSANQICRSSNCDMISAANIDEAAKMLNTPRVRRLYRVLGISGGLFLGVSLTNLLSMGLGSGFTTNETLLYIGMAILGTIMVCIDLVTD